METNQKLTIIKRLINEKHISAEEAHIILFNNTANNDTDANKDNTEQLLIKLKDFDFWKEWKNN